MLTRRSRKDSDEKPLKTKKSAPASPKTPKKSKTPVQSVQLRARSKSANSKTRIRSRSLKKTNPTVVLERLSISEKSKKDTKSKKSVESKASKVSSTTPVNEVVLRRSPFENPLITASAPPALNTRSRLANDESDVAPQLSNNIRTTNSDVEFGGLLGNLILALAFPILVILSKIALKTKGVLIPFPRGYLRYGNYFDEDVYVWSAALFTVQLIISLIPLAKKTEGLEKTNSKPHYRFSGFMNVIVGALIVAALDYYKFSITFILEVVAKKTVPHVVSSVVFALIISIGLLVIAKLKKEINQANELNYFQRFFNGTSLNPTLGPINFKLVLLRYSLLSTILFNYMVIVDSFKNSAYVHLYVVAGLQIFCALEKLAFEFNLLPSYYLQKEKLGYWTIVNLFLQPAINFLPIQILLAKKLPVNYVVLSVSAILFLFGYLCQRYCDYVKYKYETSFVTVRRSYGGRKLLEFGPWSYVRYPNYLGTIIAHFAIMLPTIDLNDLSVEGLLVSWPVFVYALYYIITLSYRCVRVSTEGRTQYGYSWDQQFASKWNLIPKIY